MKEIREIIRSYDQLDHKVTRSALAQVVHVDGSSYRRIGARMLVTDQGTWTGGISGGCLEGDALKRAKKAIISEKASHVIYDTSQEDEFQIGVGLGCNGLIETQFMPIDPTDINNPVEILRRIQKTRETQILITIISSEEESLQSGVSLSWKEQGADLQRVIPDLKTEIDALKEKSKSTVLNLTTVHKKSVRTLIEFIKPRIRCVVVGDNYDIYAMLSCGETMDWDMHLVAHQRKLRSSLPMRHVTIHSKEHLDSVPLDNHTAVVLMNHDYRDDMDGLRWFWDKPKFYLALLGPKVRTIRMIDEVTQVNQSFIDSENASFFSPAGLDLGSEGPEEIALSICAEIIAHRNKRPGTYLRTRQTSIHERT